MLLPEELPPTDPPLSASEILESLGTKESTEESDAEEVDKSFGATESEAEHVTLELN